MSYRGDLRKLIKSLRAQGWQVEKRRKHWMAFPPDQRLRPEALASTPSSRRTWRNQLARLKAKGYRE